MNRRVALNVLGVLALLAAAGLQVYRATLDPVPPGVNPVLWLLTLGCLSGGAWLLVTARTPRSPTTTDAPDAG